jgi:putative ABC transport system ATP-binding protein
VSRHEPAPEPGEPIDIEVYVRTGTEVPSPRHRPISACTVTAVSVTYSRADRVILDRVGMQVAPGESVAVIGPSGSGKTTLLALLAGLEQPDSGTVDRQCDDRTRRAGLILQGYGLVSVLTAAENVEIPLQADALGRLTPSEIRERGAAALDAVGLTAVADHLIEELSGGQQQRVAIARALAIDPPLIIADEITAELDHQWKGHVVSLVLDIARRGGIVILATHDPDIARRCSRSIHLIDGRLSR